VEPRSAKALLLSVSTVVVLLSGIACAGAGKQTAADPGATCGEERWPVKTLSDRDAQRVSLTPVPVTIGEFRAIPTPRSRPQSARVRPVELTVYTVKALVLEFKLEDDDDIHLVVADPSDPSATLIVEFPDADKCAGADISAAAAAMREARAALVARYGRPLESRFKTLEGEALITGVGFFDFQHGQRGVAPNAIELHPVLRFEPLVSPTAGGARPPGP
jgi:hypothetical protein